LFKLSKAEVGIGIVGLGFVGEKAHIPSFHSIAGSKLVAVSDIDIGHAKKVAEKYRIESVYDSYKDLIRDPKVDAVVISAPTFLHHQIAMYAISSGRHVLCEIPMAVTMQEAKEMVDAAERSGVIFMPGLNIRFTPNYAKAKMLIEERSIGNPITVFFREFLAAEVLAQQWPPNSWAWDDQKSGGGPALTMSLLSFDLLRWILQSEIVRIHSVSKDVILHELGESRGYNCLAILEFSNGALASLQFSALVRPAMSTNRLEILGDNLNSLVAIGNDRLELYGDNLDKLEWFFKEKGPRVWGHYQARRRALHSINPREQKASHNWRRRA